MRLVSLAVLGSALVVAGVLAPGSDEATGQDGVVVEPDVVRPGQRVEISVPGCVSGGRGVTSEAFARRAKDGAATVKREVEPGAYTVVAWCGGQQVTGQLEVAGRLSWPALLPADR
ncbi:hypothetical protein [Actinomadura sp. 3N407]|uniref:hypothetical protein n=1 Tax=Actinomadura sp. 3N407 TaxID=3457423 RepID=UPI003FCE3192